MHALPFKKKSEMSTISLPVCQMLLLICCTVVAGRFRRHTSQAIRESPIHEMRIRVNKEKGLRSFCFFSTASFRRTKSGCKFPLMTLMVTFPADVLSFFSWKQELRGFLGWLRQQPRRRRRRRRYVTASCLFVTTTTGRQ